MLFVLGSIRLISLATPSLRLPDQRGADRNASIFKMADQSRHRSMDTLRGYIRDAEIFKDHAGAGLL